MMLTVAVIALFLGAIMTVPWLFLLVLLGLPQILIVGLCAFLATRDGAAERAPDQPAPRRS
jgi:hypothetical protein